MRVLQAQLQGQAGPFTSRGIAAAATTLALSRHRYDSVQKWIRTRSLRTWLPDEKVSECPVCGDEFSFWKRKHHCRICGGVFCDTCSTNRVRTAGNSSMVRCCDACSDVIYRVSADREDEAVEDSDDAAELADEEQ